MTNTKKPVQTRAAVTKSAPRSVSAAKSKPSSTPKVASKTLATAPQKVTTTPADSTKPKTKLLRDSFTIPKSEYLVLEALKLRAAKLGRPSKKSEVLRAGIAALAAMNDKALLAALNFVPSIKTGRPKNVPPEKPAKHSAAAK